MIKYFNRTSGLYVLAGLSLCIVFFTCFGERGLKEVFALQKELEEIMAVNRGLEQENESLAKYINLLKHDKALIEKIAREELGLVADGEIVYFFEKKESVPGAGSHNTVQHERRDCPP